MIYQHFKIVFVKHVFFTKSHVVVGIHGTSTNHCTCNSSACCIHSDVCVRIRRFCNARVAITSRTPTFDETRNRIYVSSHRVSPLRHWDLNLMTSTQNLRPCTPCAVLSLIDHKKKGMIRAWGNQFGVDACHLCKHLSKHLRSVKERLVHLLPSHILTIYWNHLLPLDRQHVQIENA